MSLNQASFNMVKFLIIGLVILPWVFLPLKGITDPFRVPQATFLDLIFMGLIALSFFKGLKFNYRNKYLSLFAGWVLFTIFASFHLPFTLTFNNRQAINLGILAPMTHFILGLWAVFIIIGYFEKDDFEKIAKAICFSAVLITGFGVMQKVGFDPFGTIARYNHPNHFSACLDNPNIVGNYLCLSLPLFFAFKRKYILGGLFVLLGVFLSRSTLAISCSLIGICFYALLVYRKSKIIKLTVVLIIALLVIFSFNNEGFLKLSTGLDHRIENWKKGLELVKINPLFGHGLGSVKSFEIKNPENNILALVLHNDWLERMVEIGVVGVVLLLLIVFNSFRNFEYQKASPLGFSYLTSFLMFLLLMCGSFPVEIAPTVLLGLIAFTAVEKW